MKHRQEFALQGRPKINQHVATANQIEPRKGGIADQILAGKNAQFAHPLANLIAPLAGGKEPLQPLRRNIHDLASGVPPQARHLNGAIADIGGKNLNRRADRLMVQVL